MSKAPNALEQAALLAGENTWQSRAIPRLGIESFFMSDGPHGVRKQLGAPDHLGLHEAQRATCFPTAATVANSWDPALIERLGAALGAEAAWLEVDMLLGPGLNIKRSPLAGRNFEYFSEDPYLAGKLAAAHIRGVQSAGVAATPKHFAVNSQELRRMASDSIVDERTLREIYLTAFEIAVREGHPRALMSSYNLVNGVYAHENHHLLTEILRSEWGFKGVVVSDWGGSNDPVAAVRAGANLEMPAPGLDSARQLVDARFAGRLRGVDLTTRSSEVADLARTAARICHPQQIDFPAHHALARAAAEQSVVLLRNVAELLPLPAGIEVAVIGDMAERPRYQGAGSSMVNPTRLVSVREAIEAAPELDYLGYARGYRRGSAPDPELVAEAVALAKRARVVVVCCGLDEISESEGMDRAHLELPLAQIELLNALASVTPRVVVALSAGSPVTTDWIHRVGAVVHCYLGGQAGAEALVRVLTGAVNPSGKLAETYPISLADTPTADCFPARGQYAYYREGPFVGYRHYDSAGIPVRFCFGFGLSYTTFEYADLAVDHDGVELTLTNTGPVAGAETVQLYVALPGSRLVRPAKELKGFAKVWLDRGEQARVRIDFDEYTWRHFDVQANRWRVEQGTWQVLVGASSADIRLVGSLEVAGCVPPEPAGLASYRAGDIRRVSDAEFAELLGRPLPKEDPCAPLQVNSPLCELRRARNRLARVAYRLIEHRWRRAERAGVPDLDALFALNMPFRAIAKMSNGRVSMAMTEGMADLANGHWRSGLDRLIRGWFANRRDNRRAARMLAGHSPAGGR